MAFTEFCCRSGGSNLNAGTRTGNSTEPGTAADLTYASGTWVAATGVFTPASGDPVADGVAVGDFASVYADGASVTGFVGRVTARTTLTITVSLTAKAGTAPTDGTVNRTLKIGGAWLGPNAASGFPFNLVQSTLVNSGNDQTRINLKNDQTYSITSGIVRSAGNAAEFWGYTTSYGDLGKAVIDGGSNAITCLSVTTNGVTISDIITANASIGLSSNTRNRLQRCVAHAMTGNGIVGSNTRILECEAYACNSGNNANSGGIVLNGGGATAHRCISHDNVGGSNCHGFVLSGNDAGTLVDCISESNAGKGVQDAQSQNFAILNCDIYNNTQDGIGPSGSSQPYLYIENCNIIKNGGIGINVSGGSVPYNNGRTVAINCGFGVGTQANAGGDVSGLVTQIGCISYATGVTPWVDPANGDFRINLAAAKNAGRGAYTQTAASYAGTVGYPDIGAAQHVDAGGGGGLLVHPGTRGGFA